MKLKVLAAAVFVAGCLAAAAGGAFFAAHQSAATQPAAVGTVAPAVPPAAQPVAETEAVVGSPSKGAEARPAEAETPPAERATPAATPAPKADPRRDRPVAPASQDRRAGAPSQPAPAPVIAPPDRPQERTVVTTPPVEPVPDVRVPDSATRPARAAIRGARRPGVVGDRPPGRDAALE